MKTQLNEVEEQAARVSSYTWGPRVQGRQTGSVCDWGEYTLKGTAKRSKRAGSKVSG